MSTTKELIFTREHTTYARFKKVWTRNKQAYEGGKPYVDLVLQQHPSEYESEFKERKNNAYYINLPRKIATRITDYVLSSPPMRVGADKMIVDDFDRQGTNVNEVMRQLKIMLQLYSKAWLFVDMPEMAEGGTIEVSLKEKRDNKIRPYAYAISPLAVTDWCYNPDGELDWAIITNLIIQKTNPFNEPVYKEVRVLWTRERWFRYTRDVSDTSIINGMISSNYSSAISEEVSGKNEFGKVPLIELSDISEGELDSRPVMEDIVRISDAITRGESELITNIVKQMYGLLVLPESFMMGNHTLMEQMNDRGNQSEPYYNNAKNEFGQMISRSSCIIEAADETGIARYISPDGVTTAAIAANNDRLVKLLYELMGFMVLNSTTQRESASSKAWSAQDQTANLQTQAERLEQVELKAWKLMNSVDPDIPVPQVSYNRDFSVKDFKAMVMGIIELASVDGGESYQKAVKSAAVELLDKIVKLPEGQKITILNEIDNSTTDSIKNVDLINFQGNNIGKTPQSLKAVTNFDKGTESVTTTQSV